MDGVGVTSTPGVTSGFSGSGLGVGIGASDGIGVAVGSGTAVGSGSSWSGWVSGTSSGTVIGCEGTSTLFLALLRASFTAPMIPAEE